MKGNQTSENNGVAIAFLAGSRQDFPRQRREFEVLLREAITRRGYRWEQLYLEDHPKPGSAEREMQQRGVGGVIALAMQDEARYRQFRWEHFCVVQILTAQEPYLALPVVRSDPFGAMREAGERVLKQEPASAAIQLVKSATQSITDLRFQAAAELNQKAWREVGIADCRIHHVNPGDLEIRQFVAELAQDLPEVLICQNTMLVWALRERKIRFGEDLKIIFMGMSPKNNYAGFCQQFDQIAERAVEMLEEYMRDEVCPPLPMPRAVVIPEEWQPGFTFPE